MGAERNAHLSGGCWGLQWRVDRDGWRLQWTLLKVPAVAVEGDGDPCRLWWTLLDVAMEVGGCRRTLR